MDAKSIYLGDHLQTEPEMSHQIDPKNFGFTPLQWAAQSENDEGKTEYSEGFSGGDSVITNGGISSGEGIVVNWNDAFFGPRMAGIPVFIPKFSSTYFWWYAPHQLKKIP
jgi:hypothetical protein